MTEGSCGPDLEDSRHRSTNGDTLKRVLGERGHVVRDDDSSLVGGPFQNRRVICARKAHVLNANDIELRVSAKEPSDDVSVEVLVRCKP